MPPPSLALSVRPIAFVAYLFGSVACLFVAPSIATAQFTRLDAGTLTADAGESSGASWVDFDNDGDFDIYISNRFSGGQLFENTGEGEFTKNTATPLSLKQSIGNCWADYDNDGDWDVFTAGVPSSLFRNDGGDFTDVTSVAIPNSSDLRGWACAWGDYDADGFVDLFVTHPAGFVGSPSRTNALLHNRQDGSFEAVEGQPPVQGLAPYTVGSWSDYDDDGDLDLFVGAGPADGTTAPDFLYENQLVETGSPDFEIITASPIATDRVDGQLWRWVDWDNDGDLDAYLTNYWGGQSGGMANNMYRNDDGSFVRVTTEPPAQVRGLSLSNVWGDFDNDGDLDLFVTNTGGSLGAFSHYFENDGSGMFTSRSLGPPTSDRASRWGGVMADMDGDGDLDLFVPSIRNSGNGASKNFLYRNDLDNGNHWLRLRLRGTASNWSAVGAVIRAKATIGGVEVWQRRDVSTQDAFGGQSMSDVHFGLGDAASVTELVLEWPSGLTERLMDVSVDQIHEVTEGLQTAVGPSSEQPEQMFIVQVYPNPLRTTGELAIQVRETSAFSVSVVDLLGRRIRLIHRGVLEPGEHHWPVGTQGMVPGVYAVLVETGQDRAFQLLAHVR